MYKVRNDMVKKLKEEYSTNGSYVSTSDILCTWLFGGCKTNKTVSPVFNMRGRISGLQNNMAGNYIISTPVIVSGTPKDFRNRWSSILNKDIPCDEVTGDNYVSNLISLYHQVDFEGCEHSFHLQIGSSKSDLEAHLSGGMTSMTDCFMWLFKLNREDIGVLIGVDRNTFDDDYFINNGNLLQAIDCIGPQRGVVTSSKL